MIALKLTIACALMLLPAARAGETLIDDELKPTPADAAVDGALKYLAGQQRDDGSWNSGYGGPNAGVSSLALLAFMANGNTPERGKYCDVVAKGLNYIVKLPDRGDGLLVDRPSHGPMYSHGITTIMLSEAYGMTKSEEVKKRLDAAVRLVIQAQKMQKDQNNRGGWRYQSNSGDSDISCTGWQLVALRSAKNCDLDVPKESIEQAIGYIKRCNHPSGGFGYQPGGGPQQSRTGTGVLALQLCGLYDDSLVIKGADYLMQNPLKWESEFFYYALYHCSNAMFQAGDKYWEFWQPHIEKILLEKQSPDKSWPPSPGDSHASQAGPVYMTAMATLALSIQYRYLPIYQR
ncbi:MAG TPA: prenyltransferase/squalene oxidase repeat-containing protein [Planctomycetota bacterium]|nr:prenyltransferase/squalene oxidase repeat-containing protein [Planctomycetota bacterium]